MNRKEEQLRIYLETNCSGRENIQNSGQLERALHVNKTELCRLVHRLRRRGVPIASSKDGYFFAVTAGEVYSTIRQLRRMVGGLDAAIGGLEGALEKFGPAASAGGDSP